MAQVTTAPAVIMAVSMALTIRMVDMAPITIPLFSSALQTIPLVDTMLMRGLKHLVSPIINSIGELTVFRVQGEADGRMYDSGTFHECLLGHSVECSDSCPQYVPKSNGEFDRSDSCYCD